jgi:uncharacterized protein YecA (UPF0149 family)
MTELEQEEDLTPLEEAEPELANLIQWIVEGNSNGSHRIEVHIPIEGHIRIENKTQIKAVRKPGRNELCLCGSGRKYKRCCGRNE